MDLLERFIVIAVTIFLLINLVYLGVFLYDMFHGREFPICEFEVTDEMTVQRFDITPLFEGQID